MKLIFWNWKQKVNVGDEIGINSLSMFTKI
jgi:hypothetical protein